HPPARRGDPLRAGADVVPGHRPAADEPGMDVEAGPRAGRRADPPGAAAERGARGGDSRPGGVRRPAQREGLRGAATTVGRGGAGARLAAPRFGGTEGASRIPRLDLATHVLHTLLPHRLGACGTMNACATGRFIRSRRRPSWSCWWSP